MAAGQLAGQGAVHASAGLVEADDLNRLAAGGVLGLHGVQRGDAGGVPDVRVGQVDDDVVGIAGVVEPGDQVVAGGEEQLPGDGVQGMAAVGVDDGGDLRQMSDPAGEDSS
jgi:hypothetical protein